MSELEEGVGAGQAHTVVRELHTEDVREVKNGLVFRILGLGCGHVGLDAFDFLIRS
jgi:hypothetical protein